MAKKPTTPVIFTWTNSKTGETTAEPPEWLAKKIADVMSGKFKKPWAV